MRYATEPSQRTPSESSQSALALFFALAEKWSLTTDQQIRLLGAPARSTFFKWKKEGGLISEDTFERISHLLSIYKALQILFPDPDRADAWLRRPNKYFEDYSALDMMLGGKLSDIYRVRLYVDAQRGG
jgi:uncharacterized protein (DUF2384 family)